MIKDLGDGNIYCYYIEAECPYEWDCDECEVHKAYENYQDMCDKARELSVLLQNQTEQERYDEYHADDYKRNLEDRLLKGE
jgi:hypothetical protein